MNSIQLEPDTPLVDLVSFKWLMAGRGWWVDLARLRRDAEYASLCARRGAESGLDLTCLGSVGGPARHMAATLERA